jgi:DNA-directed RNA polymerase subunit RPC12/RpoP
MPQLQTMSSSHNKPAIPAAPDNVVCPTCQRTMAIREVMPSMSVIGVGETVYVCDGCGTETHRTAKRP